MKKKGRRSFEEIEAGHRALRELLATEVRMLKLTLGLCYYAPLSPVRQKAVGAELALRVEEFARGILGLSRKPRDELNMTERELVDRHRLLRVHPLGQRLTHDQARDYLKVADKKIEGPRKRRRLEKAMDRYGLGHHRSVRASGLVCHHLVCRWLDEHEEERGRFRANGLSYHDVLEKAEVEYLGWPPYEEREKT